MRGQSSHRRRCRAGPGLSKAGSAELPERLAARWWHQPPHPLTNYQMKLEVARRPHTELRELIAAWFC